MNWASVDEFLRMGGYGLYVWGSYLMTVIAIGIEIVALAARHRAALRATRNLPAANS